MRRPLSVWGGPVQASGPGEARDLLRRAMAAEGDTSEFTHGFHPYPARMPPRLARTLLEDAAGRTVLDPFCGSGTVTVEAAVRGCRAIGRDISPLAVRLSRLKSTPWPDARLEDALGDVEQGARTALQSKTQSRPPNSARREFAPHIAWELAALRDAIKTVRDPRTREALLLCFSSILVKLSRLEGVTSSRPVQKHLPHGRALHVFDRRVRELSAMLAGFSRAVPPGTPPPDVRAGDARELAGIPDASVDLVLTSPPYPGAYRYTAGTSFDWLGLRSAGREIGARGHPIAAYRKDLTAAMRAIRRVLAPGGRAFVVIQAEESQIEGLARDAALKVVAGASQPRAREAREHLLMLQRR